MKKKIAAVLLAAALLMSFSACGSTDKEKDSKNDSVKGDLTVDENKAIADAKDALTKWYDCMNKAEYSEAMKYMTPGYASVNGYDKLTDGEPMTEVKYEINTENAMLSTDDNGTLVVIFPVKIFSPDEQDIFMTVTCFENGALITSDSVITGETAETSTTQAPADPIKTVDLSSLASTLAPIAFEAASAKASELSESGNMLPDGEYSSASDDNEIMTAMHDTVDPMNQGYELIFKITVADGIVTQLEITATDSLTAASAVYPIETAQ